MAKNPSTRLYWNDVKTDEQLALCSMSAQGLWWRMMAIMANAGGYLKIDGKPVAICLLARLTGQDRRNTGRWVANLEKHGIFSRDEEGTIFCRRMVRAHRMRPKSAPKTPREHEAQPGLFDQKPCMTLTQDSESEDIYIHVADSDSRVDEPVVEPAGPRDRPPKLSRYDLLVAITREAALKCERERLRSEAEAIRREGRCGGTDPPGERLWRRPATVEPQRAGMDRSGQACTAGCPP